MHAPRWLAADAAVGVLVTGLGYYAAAPVGAVLLLPGIVVAFGLQLVARVLGTGVGTFDGDEIPGPVAWWLGYAANALVWAFVFHAGRRLAGRSRSAARGD